MAELIYGKNAVIAAVQAKKVKKIFLALHFSDPEILSLARSLAVPVERIEESKLDALISANHQGIIAEVNPFQYQDLLATIQRLSKEKQSLIVMIDKLQDPQNFGGIIRNALGFNVDAIIIKKDGQVGVTPAVSKIASGALSFVDIIQVINLSQTIETFKKNGYWIVASMLSDQAIDYRKFDYRQRIVLILGSEGKGVSPLVAKHADVHVMIPMNPKLQSFNVTSSSAILLAEINNQRFPLK
jgi:23S rRNA (guanosine2251-2'-O)-methyltransferase